MSRTPRKTKNQTPDRDSPDAAELTSIQAEQAATAAAAKRAKAETIGRYVAMFAMPLIIVGMMVTGNLGTMHAPAPHNMPIAVVVDVSAGSPAAGEFARQLEAAEPDAVDVRIVGSTEAARQLVMDRDVSGAVSIADGGATVLTAGSAGASQATVVTSLVAPQILSQGLTLASEDLAPLPANDPAGLGAMFLATALVMAGYLPFSMVVSNSPELLRFKRAIPLLAGWAALVAALVWLVTGPILGVVDGHAAAVLGIAWLGVFAIGSVQLLLTRFLGPMATIAAMLLLTVLGMPASNMSMSVYTMPGIFTFLHSILPTPAIGEALRSVLYFNGVGTTAYLLVLVIGGAAALLLTLLVDALRRRRNPQVEDPKPSIPSLHGGPRPKTRRMRYGALLLFPLAMVTMMISVMLGAMSSPTPRDMPVAIVGTTVAQAEQAAVGLEASMPGLFDLRPVDFNYEVRTQVADRVITAAFVLPSAENTEAAIITNQAGSSSAKQVVTRVFEQVAAGQHVPLITEELAPLKSNDTSGSVGMYLAMGWMLAGFLVIIVGASAAPQSRPLPRLLPVVAVYAAFMSVVLYLIASPITGSVDGHFWPIFGIGTLAIFCVALFSAVFERLMGMFSIIPLVGILIMAGVPSSGGALSIYMAPDIFRVLHGILPMPAAVESIRSVLYFGADTVPGHLLTFGVWGAVSLVLLVIIDKIKPPRTELHPIDDHEPVAPATEKELVSV